MKGVYSLYVRVVDVAAEEYVEGLRVDGGSGDEGEGCRRASVMDDSRPPRMTKCVAPLAFEKHPRNLKRT